MASATITATSRLLEAEVAGELGGAVAALHVGTGDVEAEPVAALRDGHGFVEQFALDAAAAVLRAARTARR